MALVPLHAHIPFATCLPTGRRQTPAYFFREDQHERKNILNLLYRFTEEPFVGSSNSRERLLLVAFYSFTLSHELKTLFPLLKIIIEHDAISVGVTPDSISIF